MDKYAELRAALEQTCHALLIDDPEAIRALLAERDALAAEIQEQARLLGGGAERELRLLAERDALREALTDLTSANDHVEYGRALARSRAALAQGGGDGDR